ncbi:hypothetical protein [Leptospira interrogans]|uniref:Uncharacterized protein n=2 Tax=Leptospira interrogans TaxID=173 RepID=A0A0E2D8P6_LEPIR|nr:hypothetical protein [Leptospira interrogans]KAA1292925.1 hypothetical protein C4X99_03415 [Leptospira interrogans serovar Geyaweera]EKR56460.1 hypothetical protein LEP1GSC105_4244 [Leptospira interrogans str. UI 12758]EMN93020.1 hypothetical protein LEP1GSC110_0251 [Leptospira interrogans serovar Medanensis str. UT053]KAA1293010.1 hypothetical protein C4X99_03910 [Leptospira interrogans serovar Geyaweera]MCL8311304.1 hypothetical protein [Leptospira interrogans]
MQETEKVTNENPNIKEETKNQKSTKELEFTEEVLALDEISKQTLFDSLYSAFVNTENRDTVLYLVLTKASKLLREKGVLKSSPEKDTEFSNRILKLSSQVRQVLFDSVSSAIENQNSRDTVLHILFWKSEKLLFESEK